MTITAQQIDKISRLARIEISPEHKLELEQKLGKILDWMEVLNEVNTNNIEPLSSVHTMQLVMAKDEVFQDATVEEILSNAPNAKYNYFTTPKVIE